MGFKKSMIAAAILGSCLFAAPGTCRADKIAAKSTETSIMVEKTVMLFGVIPVRKYIITADDFRTTSGMRRGDLISFQDGSSPLECRKTKITAVLDAFTILVDGKRVDVKFVREHQHRVPLRQRFR